MTPVIEAKRNALTAYKANPSEQNLHILRAARSKVQQCARQCANDYWLQLCSQIQIAADTGMVMYDGIKQPLGPTQKKTAPLKSATGVVGGGGGGGGDSRQRTTDGALGRTLHWAMCQGNVVTEDVLNAIECLPELEELDGEPTIEELSEALDSLASGKEPGKDGSFEVLQRDTHHRVAWNPLPLLEWRPSTTRREGCYHRHTVQKTKTTEAWYRWESLFTCSTEEAPSICRASLPWIAVRLQCQQIHYRHDPLPQTTSGEM